LSHIRPSELLILLKDRDGELILAASGEPPLQLYLEEGKVSCARLGADALAWDELVKAISRLYEADEIAFLYRRGIRPRECPLRYSVPADRLIHETLTQSGDDASPAS